MKRGVVMSIHSKHAVVMTRDGRFLKAPLRGNPQIGEEIAFEEELPSGEDRKRIAFSLRGGYARYGAAAAVLCLLLSVVLVYAVSSARTVVAYVTIDINPSIEIGIDKSEKVRVLRALNSDGEIVIEGLKYRGMDIEAVAASILNIAGDTHYLDTPYKDIFITSMLVDGSSSAALDFEAVLARKLDHKLQEWLTEHGTPSDMVHITTLLAPEELRLAAEANGLSAGKMAVYLMAKSEGFQLGLDELRSQSIHDATESMGGVKNLVSSEPEVETKQMLQELLQQEQSTASAKPSATPKPAPTAKPVLQSETTRPASPSAKPGIGATPDSSAKPGRGQGRDNDDRGNQDQGRDNDDRGGRGQGRDNDDRGGRGQGRDNDDRGGRGQGRDNDDRGGRGQGRDNDDRGNQGQGRDNDDRGGRGQGRDNDDRGNQGQGRGNGGRH
ncbi:anti-sigma factor domain-containing protein [Paenibacillus sp. CAU 1782]